MRRPTGLRSGSSRLQDVERDSHEVEWSKRLPEASLLFSADLGTRFSMGSMGTLVLLSKSLINSVQSMNSSLFPEPHFIPAASSDCRQVSGVTARADCSARYCRPFLVLKVCVS